MLNFQLGCLRQEYLKQTIMSALEVANMPKEKSSPERNDGRCMPQIETQKPSESSSYLSSGKQFVIDLAVSFSSAVIGASSSLIESFFPPDQSTRRSEIERLERYAQDRKNSTDALLSKRTLD